MEKGLSRNTLKVIAIVTIIIGHFFLYTLATFRGFGLDRTLKMILMSVCFVGPPIFMFFISEGFRYTSSKKRYALRLLVFALITQAAHSVTAKGGLGFDVKGFFLDWNVILALLLGFLDLCVIESEQKPAVKVLGILALLSVGYFTRCEWGVFGQLMIMSFHLMREKKAAKFLTVSVLMILSFVLGDIFAFGGSFQLMWLTALSWMDIAFGIVGTALVCFLYHGKNGRKSKFIQYSFYTLYPLHLLIIAAVNLIFGKAA